mmetsp:Transcript_52720/g.107548  ORF Transcript_52720/g.107548 Transcript_52720/m.107548 type:complete len:177 (-) Transcript_52720:245-775(-)
MRKSTFLTYFIFVYLKTLMDSSSEVNELSSHQGPSIEGQFIASLLPPRSQTRDCTCTISQSGVRQSASPSISAELVKEQLSIESSLETEKGPFYRVMLLDDDFHTLDYAMEAVEKVLKTAGVGSIPGVVRRERVQWTAFQAHHYGMGIVAVLGEEAARNAAESLQVAGLGSALVRD